MTVINIETMNGRAVDVIRNELKQALSLIEGNLDINTGHASYNPDLGEVTFKVKFKIEGTETKELNDAKQIASLLEIPATAFERPVEAFINGKKRPIVISGYRSKARKYPWLILDKSSGNEFTVDENYVQQQFRQVA